MTLATRSSYSGERANARAAARRLAASHGMSLGELTLAGTMVEPPPRRERNPESGPEVDRDAGRWQARRTSWNEGEGDAGESPAAEALRQYARMRREEREEQQRCDARQALIWCVLPTLVWLIGGEIVLRLLANFLTAS